ncbi:unnamed protein product [Prorocentrum cordatum]|uniref:Protein of centriole 5 n=1 Tax=Prorocentrum cordatum TaxID=2364126 RepID=A0ABN9WJH9_9DINO|nr:unnamed protein product [Polarella glacialis]
MELTRQYTEQLLLLRQATQHQKAALRQQTNALTLQYRQKKAEEDITLERYRFHREHSEIQAEYAQELAELQRQQAAAARQVAAQREELVKQAALASLQANAAVNFAAKAYCGASFSRGPSMNVYAAGGSGACSPRPGEPACGRVAGPPGGPPPATAAGPPTLPPGRLQMPVALPQQLPPCAAAGGADAGMQPDGRQTARGEHVPPRAVVHL